MESGSASPFQLGIEDEFSDDTDASQYQNTTRQLQRGYLSEGPLGNVETGSGTAPA